MCTLVQPLKQLVFQWPQHPESAWLRKYALRGHKRGQALCSSVETPQCLWKAIPGLCLPTLPLLCPWIAQSPSKWALLFKIDVLWMFGLRAATKLREDILMISKHKRKCDDNYCLQEFPCVFCHLQREKMQQLMCLQWGKYIIFGKGELWLKYFTAHSC